MAAFTGRGAQTINFTYFKSMLRQAFHRKSSSPDMISDTAKFNGEEVMNSRSSRSSNSVVMTNCYHQDSGWWVPDDRTGIFCPKGQEKVMENVPAGAAKDVETINWFH